MIVRSTQPRINRTLPTPRARGRRSSTILIRLARAGTALRTHNIQLLVVPEQEPAPICQRRHFDGSKIGVVVRELGVCVPFGREVEVVALDVDVRCHARYGFARYSEVLVFTKPGTEILLRARLQTPAVFIQQDGPVVGLI